jgi:hypothetical protein
MIEPDQNDPVSSSEMTNPDAASPSAEIHPASLASLNPPAIEAPPMPLSPMPVLNALRPPAAGLPRLTPKPSSAPPPRLRPAAPPEAPNNIGPGSPSQTLLTESEISATQEIAEALTTAHRTPSAPVVPRTGQPVPSSDRAQISRPHSKVATADPLYLRRTTIPILLTLGVILAGAGVLLLFGGENNALPDLFPSWVPIVFCVLASICLGLAVLNMLSVKNAKP